MIGPMENNNSIPYGTISWDNEDSFPSQRASQRTSPARNHFATESNFNGVRYSLRGPQFPPPSLQRLDGVGLSRQMGLSYSRHERQQTPRSNFHPMGTSSSISSSPTDVQHERFFSLRPVLNAPSTHVQIQSTQLPLTNNILANENPTFSSRFFNSLPGSVSVSEPSAGSPSRFLSSNDIAIHNTHHNNNNVEIPQDERLREGSRTKRKSSHSDNDEGHNGPACKQFLSEERMAARMHNLRISNDHNYPVNIMQSVLDGFVGSQAAGYSVGQFANDSDELENEGKPESRKTNMPTFVLHPEIKDALNENQVNSIIPEAIYKQMCKPCLAVIPWKTPDDKINLSTENKTADQENDVSGTSSCMSLVMESIPENEQFQDKGVQHVEVVSGSHTFSLQEDDMEL
ncbi:uncharacterized protein LOC114959742 isoform X1 [Acropora millepora]|uniref:uncharacterized protein LOC114959742 isoform X1 n=1 Tax=Acropora millepora TaxID=45264 RepID=UPI001CF1AA7A|nr:uncharacterized protein LOC114959742 isoform X1 [Acropora millepora]